MGGEDHLVERFDLAILGDHGNLLITTEDATDRGVQSDAIAQWFDQLSHVLLRTANDGLPLRTIGDRHQAVVIAEAEKELSREVEDLLWIGRPDGGGHRHKVLLTKHRADATVVEKLPDSLPLFNRLPTNGLGAESIELQDIPQHVPVAGRGDVLPTGEQTTQAAALVFQFGFLAADTEAHIAVLRVYFQHIQQAAEVGVGSIVEDHEPGIDVVRLAVELASDRVTVAAWIAACLEKRDVVIAMQQSGNQVATDATPDDGDPLTMHSVLSTK